MRSESDPREDGVIQRGETDHAAHGYARDREGSQEECYSCGVVARRLAPQQLGSASRVDAARAYPMVIGGMFGDVDCVAVV